MTRISSFLRGAAAGARQASAPTGVSLAGLAMITVFIALVGAAIALPYMTTRERGMVGVARAELSSILAAVDEFRALHYRLPDTIEDLAAVGYAAGPSVAVCDFRHVPDQRGFDDHLEIAVHHRASGRALTTRYPPSDGRFNEMDVELACNRDAAPAAATQGR